MLMNKLAELDEDIVLAKGIMDLIGVCLYRINRSCRMA